MKAALPAGLYALMGVTSAISSAATKPRTTTYDLWAGALVNTTGVQGVRGSFVVPKVAKTSIAQIAIGIDGFNCESPCCNDYPNGFLAGVGWQETEANGPLEYYGYHQQDGYLTSPEMYNSTEFAVGPGDRIGVEIVALSTSEVSLLMFNVRSGSYISKTYTVNTLCLNSVEWYVFNCQNNAISCPAMGHFDQVTISNPQYKLANEDTYTPAEQSKESILITPVKFYSPHGDYDEAMAQWSNKGDVVITAGNPPK